MPLDADPSFHAGRRVRYTVSPHAACNRGEAPQGCASTPLAVRGTPNTDAKHIRVMRGCPATIAALTYPLGHRRVLRKGADWRRPVAPCAESFVLLDGVAALLGAVAPLAARPCLAHRCARASCLPLRLSVLPPLRLALVGWLACCSSHRTGTCSQSRGLRGIKPFVSSQATHSFFIPRSP